MRTAGKEVESEGLLDLLWAHGHDDRVASVVASGASGAYIELGREDVYELPLAFISPLRTQNHSDWQR